jgi:hypothetical protein
MAYFGPASNRRQRVSKGNHAFKETDVARAIRAAKKGGMNVGKLKITKQGEIEIEAAPPSAPDDPTDDEVEL